MSTMKTQRTPLSLGQSEEPVTIARVLAPERVCILEAGNKQAALDEVLARLSRAPEIGDAAELKQAIHAREELLSTGIGQHIGVPHVRIDSVSDIAMAVGVAPGGLADYESLDGLPVYLVFAIAAHSSQHNEHIRLLAQISKVARDAESRRRVLASKTPEELYAHLTGEEV